MFYIAVASILALVAVVAALTVITAKRKIKDPYSYHDRQITNPVRRTALMVMSAGIAALLVLTLVCSFARIGPREVGIETALGKYSRTLGPGWQPKAPWASVEAFSTQLQRTELDAPVAFAESGGGTQHAVVQWKITGAEAEQLWQRYKEFDNVQAMLVDPAAKQAIGDVLAGYTPAESRAEGAGEKIRAAVHERLEKSLAEYGVELDSVAMPPTGLDDTAQDAYNRVVEAKANVERADERVQQAKLDAEADKARNAELTPENLVSECLNVTNNWNDDKNGPLPASWNCLGGQGTTLVTETSK